MDTEDIRWKQRFVNFKKALTRLAEITSKERVDDFSELEKEGMVQRFEYTYELAWKTLQDFLRHKGYTDIAGPTPVLTQAVQYGYIVDAEGWKRMKKVRELSSHTYDGDTAEEIVAAIASSYFNLLDQLRQRLEKDRYGEQTSLF